MNTTRSMLLRSLANTISDYRQNEIMPVTPAHVEKWLNQFEQADQLTILTEMDAIMKRFYFSRVRVKESVRAFLKKYIITNDSVGLLPHVHFLDIQRPGSSQGAMLAIVNEILREEYNVPIAMTGTEKIRIYVYIDDCVYTGSTFRYNLTDGTDTTGWLSNCPSSGTLWVYTIGGHTEGIDYVRSYVQAAAEKKQIKLARETTLMIDNVRGAGNSIEVLWPEYIAGDADVDSYVGELPTWLARRRGTDALFRGSPIVQETLFSSPEARRVVEQAFLKKGIAIIKAGRTHAPSMHPLGFMKLNSLGFGTYFVMYRNIANNCPLVLWWGEAGYPSTHPFGQWYPLFPRRTNERRDILAQEQTFDSDPFWDLDQF